METKLPPVIGIATWWEVLVNGKVRSVILSVVCFSKFSCFFTVAMFYRVLLCSSHAQSKYRLSLKAVFSSGLAAK